MEVTTETTPKFRIQNQRILLTYRSHLDKFFYTEWFKSMFPCKDIHIAHENSDPDHPYEHTHVLIDFGKVFQSRNCRVFDYLQDGSTEDNEINLHPHIKQITSKLHWTRSCNYLAKEDPDCSYLRVAPSWADGVWAQPTIQDALRVYGDKKSASNVIRTYEQRRNNDYTEISPDDFTFSLWNQELHDELLSADTTRSIIWYYDEHGNSGKSAFCRFMIQSYPDRAILLTQMGGQYHTGTIIFNAITNGWDGDIVLIDLARDFEFKDIYSPIEALKNGIITALKYSGGTKIFNRCKIVVFSNFLPNIEKASYNRWDIRQLMTQQRPKVIPSITQIPMSMIVPVTDTTSNRPLTLNTIPFPERPLTLNILK